MDRHEIMDRYYSDEPKYGRWRDAKGFIPNSFDEYVVILKNGSKVLCGYVDNKGYTDGRKILHNVKKVLALPKNA